MFKTINGGKLPTKATKFSAAVDLYANADVVIKAGDTWKDISRMYSINRITKPRKSKEDIHSVCKCLSEGLSFEFILEKFPTFNRKDIYRIKNKQDILFYQRR